MANVMAGTFPYVRGYLQTYDMAESELRNLVVEMRCLSTTVKPSHRHEIVLIMKLVKDLLAAGLFFY